jgi:Lon protease-like protein
MTPSGSPGGVFVSAVGSRTPANPPPSYPAQATMQIPLFPLHTVLSPGLALPLHVFEERYRLMVRRCVDESTPFGVVLIHEGREVAPRDGAPAELAIASVGTFAEIREASRYADGRWELLTVGAGRFVIETVKSGLEPYLVAEVEPLDDPLGDAATADALVRRVSRRFVEYLGLLQPRDGEAATPIDVQVEVDVPDEPVDAADDGGDARDDGDDARDNGDDAAGLATSLRIPADPSQLSFLLTGILQVEPFRKQALLEATTAEHRLRELDRILDRELILLRRRLAPYRPDRRVIGGPAS